MAHIGDKIETKITLKKQKSIRVAEFYRNNKLNIKYNLILLKKFVKYIFVYNVLLYIQRKGQITIV